MEKVFLAYGLKEEDSNKREIISEIEKHTKGKVVDTIRRSSIHKRKISDFQKKLFDDGPADKEDF